MSKAPIEPKVILYDDYIKSKVLIHNDSISTSEATTFLYESKADIISYNVQKCINVDVLELDKNNEYV